ncbi:MAG: hypothetical protein ACO1Q7_04490 [Gemmatimonas sp.]
MTSNSGSAPGMIETPLQIRRREPQHFAKIVVIGGGCYGSWYTQQLLRARASGAIVADRIVVVDRNPASKVIGALRDGSIAPDTIDVITTTWAEYLSKWFAAGAGALAGHALVPSPLMPHLLLDWVVAQASARWPARTVRVAPLERAPRIPWERAAPDGRHYVSFAEWLCPVNCVEPSLCPATGGPRSWSVAPALSAYVHAQDVGGARNGTQRLLGPVMFPCIHRSHGVGMIDAAPIAHANERIAEWGATADVDVLVGTVSHCHGALGVLSVRS